MIAKYVTNTYEIMDAYQSILIEAENASVNIEPSDNGETKLVVFEKKRRPYKFSALDGTLTVRSAKAKWYHRLRIGIDRSQIKLYVPASGLDDISVKSNVSHVDMSLVNCNGAIDISINTGRMKLEGISCKSFHSKGNTGSLALNNFTARESISIKRNTGKVLLNDCKSPEIIVKTNTGRVSGKLPTGTAFAVHTNTGKVELPKAPLGEAVCGRCEIKTNTGSVKFE